MPAKSVKAASPPEAGRTCIFCGSGSLTKEHVWSSWIDPLIRKASNTGRDEYKYAVGPGDSVPRVVSKRSVPEATIDKQMKVVCAPCNNGWMSDIENTVKDFMTLLITGKPCDLDIFAQRQIANWMTLKMMVAEQNDIENKVTTLEQRIAFKDHRAIPAQTNIYIARCGTGGWESAYWRIAEAISDSLENRPDGKNTHSVTFGIGQLLMHASHTSMPNLNLGLVVNDPTLIFQIWPIKQSIVRWPPRRALLPAEARVLADTLSRLSSSPGTRRVP
jgi:hypothetical protein